MTSTSPAVLQVEDLHVRYGQVHAVRGVSFEVGPGEIVALIGPNGGGKTSLLRALLGIGPGSAAGIRFLGEDVRGAPTHARARRGMVLVPEGRSLFPELTIEENLRIPLIARRSTGDTGLEEVLELFPRLRERSGQRAGSLSGGEQQMLAIGRALLSSPQLLLLDEVSLGLHPRIVDDVYDALRTAIARTGLPTLVVEQHVEKALGLSDRAYVIVRGSIVEAGRSQDLRADTDRITSLYLSKHRDQVPVERVERGHGHADVALTVTPAAKRRLARQAAARGVTLDALVEEAMAAGLEQLEHGNGNGNGNGNGTRRPVRAPRRTRGGA